MEECIFSMKVRVDQASSKQRECEVPASATFTGVAASATKASSVNADSLSLFGFSGKDEAAERGVVGTCRNSLKSRVTSQGSLSKHLSPCPHLQLAMLDKPRIMHFLEPESLNEAPAPKRRTAEAHPNNETLFVC